MKKILCGVVACLAVSSCLNASMFENNQLNAKVGTLGAGLEYSTDISSSFTMRTGFNTYSLNKSLTESNVNYDANVDLRTYSLIVDYHPFENGFKLSGGAMYNGNKADITANPTANTITFNDTTYSTSDVGNLKGNVEFNKVAPYIGIGYDSAKTKKSGFSFNTEIGAMLQGSPKATLTAEYGSAVTSAQKDQINSDLKAEEAQLNSELSNFKIYPVVSLGIGYKF